ncbi:MULTISPECIES: hypothetical protein [unclassified Mycolicibacterium]|uniref:hypothetical protein n=1 Tax=unclassified Mycolicibacterium TaxID=2636767 RepID=UPI0012DC73CE|nr:MULTISPECIES: hypothetical protein [unclassified Mycolicibacterium]MUL83759.1 hypothetical protein [Mycolicibacterium sp. CBMA 329]MUL90750.1 hypothetical protein [Mycolicibacterium sp. CBMA 331]MUM00718.1 hypothetical protein [Mycolicibacterium sp. CBMA 334]MUM27519.1 hypothetical protein [Mycolicibacterium sp. CBMA 295]MUM41694.1 hypothetical protein [Mycolicibacterium sp. CBMA 247]
MCRLLALTAATLSVTAALTTSACAHADPQPAPPGPAQTTAPQPGTSCAESLAGVLTPADAGQIGNNRRLLQCEDGSWQPFADAYPSSDRWLTTGPEVILHGQGRRNPEAKAGTWTASPQTAEALCSVEVVDIVAAGRTSGPMTTTAAPGQPLTVEVSDHMFTVKLSGYCLWQRG